jgi:sarcosine oxidase, subunit beta
VLAAGVNTPALLAPLGLILPLKVKRVSVLQTAPLPACLDQVFGVANADCAGRQEVGGQLRLTTGLGNWPGDPDQWTTQALQPSREDLAVLVERVQHILPILKDLPHQASWGGLIDLTPDALPVIDALEPDGLVIAAGFSGHGFCLGPICGMLLSDLALGRPPRHDLSAFTLARFGTAASVPAPLTLHG